MLKKIILITCILTIHYSQKCSDDSKKENLNRMFELYYGDDYFSKSFSPIFPTINIIDKKVQEKTIEIFTNNLKNEFVLIYSKYFNDDEIKEINHFYDSKVGKKLKEHRFVTDSELGKNFMSFMKIAQEENEKANPPKESKSIIKFENIAKDKNNEEVFKEFINHDGVTVVKFSAIWCGPCKLYNPIFSEIADTTNSINIDNKVINLKYLIIDVDKSPEIAKYCEVGPIPTTIFYKNGKKVDVIIGLKNKEELMSKIQEVAKK